MGSNIAGLFPSSSTTVTATNPNTSPFQSNLGNWFNAYLGTYGADKPYYTGQMTAETQPQLNLAQQMFQAAQNSYNPQQYADIYNKYSGIANGTGPNLQSYMDAVSQKAQNEWQQNVMPGIVEKTRGYGRGSVIPESIANAGSTYYQNLAGTMAPYMLSAGQSDITNRLNAIQGMGQSALGGTNAALSVANAYSPFAQYAQTLAQQAADRPYNEYVRASQAMLPYMIQYSGSLPTGQTSTSTTTSDNTGQRVGSAVNLGLNLASMLGLGKYLSW